jgi:hypothetical protein
MDSELLTGAFPETHRGMVITRLTGTGPATFAAANAGLSVLQELEDTGKVLAVVPLTPASSQVNAGMGALGILSATAGLNDGAATSIIRLSDDTDVPRLLDALNETPEVEFATRVPTRWAASTSPPSSLQARLASAEQGMERLENSLLSAPAAPALASVWNLQKIGWGQLSPLGAAMAENIRVGVLDTGIDRWHPDLVSQLDRYEWDRPSVTGNVSDQDLVGHGTHVSGIIAAKYSTTAGTRGVCRARLSVWKIFDDTPDYIAGRNIYWYLVDPVLYRRALADCAETVDVVNLSIGGTAPPDPQEQALLQILAARGVPVVAAMGNERILGSPTSYPAAIPGVIAVGATAVDDTVAPFSNSGEYIKVAAPGVAIWSTMPHYPGQPGFYASAGPGNAPTLGAPIPREMNYATESGTSMATPHVTAAAALALANSRQPREAAAVLYLLMASADHVPAMLGQIWNQDVGAGRLSLPRLILAARTL